MYFNVFSVDGVDMKKGEGKKGSAAGGGGPGGPDGIEVTQDSFSRHYNKELKVSEGKFVLDSINQ